MAFNKAKAMQEADKLVSQRKISDAIKHYLHILDKEPSDVSLLNTVGDLYVRENNKGEALKCFGRLAEAFTKDGFTVKAIAIYKKIAKIDPSTVDTILKLADLYVLQGLNREAREQYNQAADFFKKKGQPDKALDAYRKIVALDPENRTYRARLAEQAEQMGRKDEAASAYLELAESALRAGDAATSEAALKRSMQLEPRNSQAQLLQARLAAGKQDFAQVEKILGSDPSLKGSQAGRQLLLETYLATQRVDAAKELVVEVYKADPTDFGPLASFTRLCLSRGAVDSAVGALGDAATLLLENKLASPLMETLRQIWSKNPGHVATLELVLGVAEKTNDETTLPEVLGALGHAYQDAGELEKAENIYRKLTQREPANEEYRALLNGVLEKQGKETAVPSHAALEGIEMEIPEVASEPVEDTEQAAMVKEALENSDLYSRYHLIEKAVAELEKVLASYPEQVDVHRRIFEVCQRTQPARAGQAAEALARIYGKQGDLESAKKFKDVVAQLAAGTPATEMGVSPTVPATPPPVPTAPSPEALELDLSEVFAPAAPEPIEAPSEAPKEVPVDLSPAAETPVAAPATGELDLSGDFAAFTEPAGPVEPAPAQEPGFNFDEARDEVKFYLSQGFVDEARRAVQALEEKYPADARLAELRSLVEAKATAAGIQMPVIQVPEVIAPVGEAIPSAVVEAAPEAQVLEEEPRAAGPVSPPLEPVISQPPPPAAVEAPPPVVGPRPAAGSELLGSLVGDLEKGLEGFGETAPAGQGAQSASSAPPAEEVSPLSGLLDELGEATPAASGEDDAETHYNLGVAFREMGLLDEAIGEFQKVVKGAQKGKYPPNFLQACSLLALCFMDKNMPKIATKWYMRALETPELNEESTLALVYDLGVAYEQAGDARNALDKFSEVYSQNIDYRDVAEKIRSLQQKAR